MVKVTNEVVIADFFWKNAKIYAQLILLLLVTFEILLLRSFIPFLLKNVTLNRKMKFSIVNLFNKYDQIRGFPRI